MFFFFSNKEITPRFLFSHPFSAPLIQEKPPCANFADVENCFSFEGNNNPLNFKGFFVNFRSLSERSPNEGFFPVTAEGKGKREKKRELLEIKE